ncbi:MAG: BON domain-containing protein [Armatimonadota bacterium]
MNDDALKGRIIAALANDPDVHANSIRVDVDHGRVTITGVVDTLEEKERAQLVILHMTGIAALENDLVVSADEEVLDLELERAVNDALVQAGLAGVGAKVQAGNAFLMGVVPSLAVKRRAVHAAESVSGIRGVVSELEIAAGEPVDDITLANDVTEALSESDIISMDLHVAAEDGAVRLLGQVTSHAELHKAAGIASAVPGVQHVENDLRVA